jgi:hypothetical protein
VRTREEVSSDKLRGGFYTPAPLVDLCLQRVGELVDHDRPLRVLEPGAGDGAFVRGLARSALRGRVARLTALEPLQAEADKARAEIGAASLCGEVRACSAVQWSAGAVGEYDVAVGNPPFVRYQFIGAADRAAIQDLGRRAVRMTGVSNLWIAVLMGAISRLASGGAFAFVVPSECLTGVSAGTVRAWVLANFESVQFDHFPPGSFPGVLQEIGLLSGRRAPGARAEAALRLVEHDPDGRLRVMRHRASASTQSWTRYLLDEAALEALTIATGAPAVQRLGDLARFEVSIVTGANDFFSVSDATVATSSLAPWALPLLPRTRHAPGLILAAADVEEAASAGARTNLLDFSAARPDPRSHRLARDYLAEGAARGLPGRYKCRIREPWFRVPGIRSGTLLLSKRSHDYPRVILNQAGVYTTDTIYRGETHGEATPAGVAAGFHNSLTLLSAELEGRSFGGGVLELVPSEIARLAVPVLPRVAAQLQALDRIARSGSAQELVRATDALVGRITGIEDDVIAALACARAQIRDRRLARNRCGRPADAASARPRAR